MRPDESWDSSLYWWSEGNGGCDCNRSLAFGGADDEPLECGNTRYLVVDVHGGLEGRSKNEAIEDANEDCPPDLVRLHVASNHSPSNTDTTAF